MMEISSRGRYSLRILAMMASHPGGRLFTIHEIADSECVSAAYAQQLLTALRTAGFVNSHRGKVGGFTLARPPEAITACDVLKITEGNCTLAPCMGSEKCEREASCHVRPLWVRATQMLEELFQGVTLADLAAEGETLGNG
jgi:Rrf2 family protein